MNKIKKYNRNLIMKKSLILTSLLVGVISFNGCGSSSNDETPSGVSVASSSTLNPVTTKIVCDPQALTNSKTSYDMQYAADGDITVMCKTAGGYSYGEYQLVAGVNTLTITDIEKVEEYTLNTSKIKGKGIDTYNYKAGTIQHKIDAVVNGKTEKYNCTETYPSPLPTTLTDTNSITELFDWDVNEYDRIKTTCPASYYAEDDSIDESEESLGKGTINGITNYTLTDNNGKKHLLTESAKIVFK